MNNMSYGGKNESRELLFKCIFLGWYSSRWGFIALCRMLCRAPMVLWVTTGNHQAQVRKGDVELHNAWEYIDYMLCDLRLITEPLWASFSTSANYWIVILSGPMLLQSEYGIHFSHNTYTANATLGNEEHRETQWGPAFLHKVFLYSDMTRVLQQFFRCTVRLHKVVKN